MQNAVWRGIASLQRSGGREQAAGGHRACLYVVVGGLSSIAKSKQGDIRDCSLQQDKMDENPTTKMKYSTSSKENCGRTGSIDHRLL